jgi:hypothetical protein
MLKAWQLWFCLDGHFEIESPWRGARGLLTEVEEVLARILQGLGHCLQHHPLGPVNTGISEDAYDPQ